MPTPSPAYCRRCQTPRTPLEVLIVYPVGFPENAWYVCRPALWGICFRTAVKLATVHAIAETPESIEHRRTTPRVDQPAPVSRPRFVADLEPDWRAA